jgi:DNA mismatch repair protein MutL
MANALAQRRPIRLLDPTCVERIAAGEVVERPASVVKELVENSLDAGATSIVVRLRRAGLEELVVEDDGAGIPTRELPLAVERHATSKIAGSGDLGSIVTFGFRGEALASVAAVSRLSLRSRVAEEEIGGRIDLVGGRLEQREPLARLPGTTVRVADLFFNMPARRAFLKSESSERRIVLQTLTALALAHPEVALRVEADGAVALDLPVALDLETRVHGLFGAAVCERLRRFEGEAQRIRVAGLTSLPTHTRGNRTGQFLFVNRRPVFEKTVAHAIAAAYREVLPAGRFPTTVVFLEVPPSRVDVNVHPAKAEVRFRDESAIHELVRHAILDALSLRHETALPTAQADVQLQEVDPGLDGGARAGSLALHARGAPEALAARLGEDSTEGYPRGPQWSRRKERPTLFTPQQLAEGPGRFTPSGAAPDPGALITAESARGADLLFWQLHNTFILTQIRGALVIVDQHNSHERILYDQGVSSLEGRLPPTQQLLFPATLELTPAELETYELHRGQLEAVGFFTEPFGGSTVLVRGIPAELRNWNDGALLRDLLAELADAGRTGHSPREAILASYSCHGAIRAGERLTLPEMQALMDRLFATRLPYSCPHGRPTLIRIGLPELERRFGRR